MSVATFRWQSGGLEILDQRLLPHRQSNIHCSTSENVADAIRSMAVRGAPAIGCCAAYGMVLAVRNPSSKDWPASLRDSALLLKAARPTAVNLSWAVNRMMSLAERSSSLSQGELESVFLEEASRMEAEDVEVNKSIGKFGATLFDKPSVVLTHCNAGSLATAGYGTALGVVRSLFKMGKIKKVFVDETRPYLQGARLTAWELVQEKIPHELITDSMAAHFMKTEKIDGVVVGCDRVASNGDTANKIGTYGVAVLARYHKIPFYVAMPTSTLDLSLSSGSDIPIEERSSSEVTEISGQPMAPHETKARHPAFDITPAELITAFISEKGVTLPPYKETLRGLL